MVNGSGSMAHGSRLMTMAKGAGPAPGPRGLSKQCCMIPNDITTTSRVHVLMPKNIARTSRDPWLNEG